VKRIILSGGGTGGHITPLLAVAHELKKQDPDSYVIYIGEHNGKYAHLTANHKDIDEIHQVFAGKFRRYHGESWLTRILDIKTILLNILDAFRLLLGVLQSLFLIRRLKPDITLLKGGFVGVPVGLAAAFWHKPFITHDSDTVPGLANRLVSRWARYHATGMPPEFYSYPSESIRYVGVLVGADYQLVTPELQKSYRNQLNLAADAKIIVVTGGSGGAAAINKAVRAIAPDLLKSDENIHIIHQVGVGKGGEYKDFSHPRLRVFELLNPMYAYTGAADVVVTRAGANTMAELGVQGKACVVIPNPLLTGGHQLKNAEVWIAQDAVRVLDESSLKSEPKQLQEAVAELLSSSEEREKLGNSLERLTAKNAAQKLAALLLNPR
jgi:UDP-N-acetylglucosamine--N-acetylmuramyl-(pentapeptide) pyrophosphoryl-undecaprenol N-acetylglucosamine transferase